MLIYRHNSSSIEGVNSCSHSTSQSYASMQNRDYISSSREVDFSCSDSLDESQLSMQMRYAKPEIFDQTHCLRPYISEFSHDMNTSINLAQNTTLNSTLNNSNTSTITIDFANNTIEQTNLLNFVENFSTSSPNFRTSSQRRPGLSTVRHMDRPSRFDQIRTRNLARLRYSRERFVVTRGQTTQKALTQFLNKCGGNCKRDRLDRGRYSEWGLMPSITTNRWSLRIKRKCSDCQDYSMWICWES